MIPIKNNYINIQVFMVIFFKNIEIHFEKMNYKTDYFIFFKNIKMLFENI